MAAWSAAALAEPTRPLVSVPLFVTDARGQSIPNLKLADIEVAEAGTPQKISSVVFRGAAPRRVALFLDEYHVSPGAAAARVRASVGAFVDRHLGPDDAVLVMKPLDSQQNIVPVSSLETLRATVAQFDGRRGLFEPRGPFEAQYMTSAPSSAERQRAQVVRAGLEALAIALRDGSEAAKALIVVTEGFRSSESSRMRTTTLRTISRAARLANVPIYIVDPSPVRRWSLRSTTPSLGIRADRRDPLRSRRPRAALARIAADLSAHYVLEFQAAAADDGAFHDIDVKVSGGERRNEAVRLLGALRAIALPAGDGAVVRSPVDAPYQRVDPALVPDDSRSRRQDAGDLLVGPRPALGVTGVIYRSPQTT